jgi:hypothetical protein
VLRPALAIVGAGKELIDTPLVSIGARVFEKALLLVGSGWQAG